MNFLKSILQNIYACSPIGFRVYQEEVLKMQSVERCALHGLSGKKILFVSLL